MKRDLNRIRSDLKNLTSAEFEKKYPGIDAEKLKTLSDSDLEKIVGGFFLFPYRGVKNPTKA